MGHLGGGDWPVPVDAVVNGRTEFEVGMRVVVGGQQNNPAEFNRHGVIATKGPSAFRGTPESAHYYKVRLDATAEHPEVLTTEYVQDWIWEERFMTNCYLQAEDIEAPPGVIEIEF